MVVRDLRPLSGASQFRGFPYLMTEEVTEAKFGSGGLEVRARLRGGAISIRGSISPGVFAKEKDYFTLGLSKSFTDTDQKVPFSRADFYIGARDLKSMNEIRSPGRPNRAVFDGTGFSKPSKTLPPKVELFRGIVTGNRKDGCHYDGGTAARALALILTDPELLIEWRPDLEEEALTRRKMTPFLRKQVTFNETQAKAYHNLIRALDIAAIVVEQERIRPHVSPKPSEL